MVNPRNADPFIDGPRLNPAAAGDLLKVNRAAVQSSSFTGRVVEVLEAGAKARVEYPIDDPGIEGVGSTDGGYTYVGAIVQVLVGSDGKISQIVTPSDLPDGADLIPTGATSKWLDAEASRLDAANGATRGALDAAKAELTDSQVELVAHLATLGIDVDTTVITEELWANLAVFAKVTTDMLIAGDAKITGSLLADVIQLATRLIAGNPDGTRVELDGTGLTVYRTSVDGAVLPAIRLGLAGESDFFGILDTSGDTLSSLDEDGNITGQTINANQGVTLAGQDLAGMINALPQGMISKTKLLGGTYTLSVTPQALVSTDITLPGTGDRQLRVTVGILHDSTSVQNIEAALRCSTTGTASTGNSSQIAFNFDTQANRAQSMFVWELNTSELNVDPNGDRFLSILLEAHNTSSGVTGNTILGGDHSGGETFISVEDLGAAVPTGRQTQQSVNPSTGGASQGKVTRTKTYSATACQSYLGSGAKYAYNVGKAYQGSYGSNTGLHSLWIFPSVISDLSGATVDKVVLRITNNHTVANVGGTARIQTHGQTGVPTTYAGGSAVANVAFAKGQTKDINLTSQAAAGLKSGSIRGFGLLSSAASDYGYWAGDAKLIITYTK